MPVRLYALLTWTTLRRLPLIHPGAAAFLRRLLPKIAHRHATRILGIGIVRNHVHLVLELPPLVDVPRLVQGLKGASARIANRDGVMPRAKLQWATGYDLRSLRIRDVKRAMTYVCSQDQRHPDMALGMSRAESPTRRDGASLRTHSLPSAPSQGANNPDLTSCNSPSGRSPITAPR